MSDLSQTTIGRALDAASSLPVRLLEPLARGKARRLGPLWPHQWFLAVGASLMFCVPHGVWNNLYGVLFAAAALVLYWWDCAARGVRPWNPAGLGGGVWAFLVMCLLCSLWAVFKAASLRVALFYLTGFALAYLASAAFREKESAEIVIASLYLALLYTAIYGLAVYVTVGSAYTVPIGGREVPRLCSTLEHAINYGEFVALLLPLALVWALQRRSKAWRWALSLALLLPCAALVLTYSRTGWISLGAAVLVLLWHADKRLLLPAAALGIAGFFLLPGDIQARILSMFHFSDAASSGRFTLWKECLGILRAHWLLGIGLGPENFFEAYLPFSTGVLGFQPPHSNMGYLEILLSTGAVGFAAFLSFFFGIFFRLRRRIRQTGQSGRWPLYALVSSLAGAAVGSIPEYVWFYPRILFAWCIVFGLALARTEQVL